MRRGPNAGKTTILSHVRAHLKPDGTGLTEAGIELPDEPQHALHGIRYAPGAMDGIFGHHVGGGGDDATARKLATYAIASIRKPSRRSRRRLYDALRQAGALRVADTMIRGIGAVHGAPHVFTRLGTWLVENGTDREPVKIGLALLGVGGIDDPSPVMDLGRHEEFTLFAANALVNGRADPEPELWDLARSVHGWGRIHCVERLATTSDPRIQEWILREGFRNSVMYEYLALIAATTGGLVDALKRTDPDRGVLDAAGEILEALVNDGPAGTIDHYAEAHTAVAAYVAIMVDRADTLLDYLTLHAISTFLEPGDDWLFRFERGWTEQSRAGLADSVQQVLGRPEWTRLINDGLASDDPVIFGRADRAASLHGIDTFDVHVVGIREEPLGQGWHRAWAQADDQRAALLVDLVRSTLDLDAIASGPSEAIGIGPGFEQHQALDWGLQRLPDFPGVGGDLVLAALASPTVRNRHAALGVLEAWPRQRWPEGAEASLREALPREPSPDVADRIRAALQGEVA
jgi:hypothetical protein